jgi:hypothetical protein
VSLKLLEERLPPKPKKRKKKLVSLAADARSGGLMIWAPSGWGKSVLLGAICHQDSMQRIGFVCIDIIGGTIDHALNHLLYLPRNHQLAQLKQIRYCNMAGEDVGQETYVPPFPMLTQQFANERLFHTSQRPLALIQKTDKQLATASIQGLNRLSPLLTATAMVLTALGEPLSRAYELLEGTEEWNSANYQPRI